MRSVDFHLQPQTNTIPVLVRILVKQTIYLQL